MEIGLAESGTRSIERRRLLGLFLGPVLFLALLLVPPPEGLAPEALRVGAVAVLMAVWWISEAIPIPATALIPIALFPPLGIVAANVVTLSYANHLIFLFMGGFLIAVTMERWNLHKRLALLTIMAVGVSPRRMILGFMLATASLSMWISNTATTMMMVPIGMGVIAQAGSMTAAGTQAAQTGNRKSTFGTALMLGIAYAASIGGIATLIGTPPNAILAGVVERTYGESISFTDWLAFGLPLAVTFLLLAWLYLTRFVYRGDVPVLPGAAAVVSAEIQRLGPLSREEKSVLAVFAAVAVGWILRGILPAGFLPMVGDSTIAIAGGLLLFLIPVDLRRGRFLLDWATAVRIPWDIILLFGGGFALAEGFRGSGLTQWVANEMPVFQGAPPIVLVFLVGLVVIFLTEVTSNTATASLMLPVMAAFAEALHVHPYGLMVTVALAASFAFMLPVATPPNAIVFGSRYLTIPQMAKAGLWMNLVGAVLLTLFVVLILPALWGLHLG